MITKSPQTIRFYTNFFAVNLKVIIMGRNFKIIFPAPYYAIIYNPDIHTQHASKKDIFFFFKKWPSAVQLRSVTFSSFFEEFWAR